MFVKIYRTVDFISSMEKNVTIQRVAMFGKFVFNSEKKNSSGVVCQKVVKISSFLCV